ncbi:MAG: hypothetical protein BAA01_10570 [Bacillus thermozeamaize]|uniref:Uncharacterized protein n=1 Tax=Bacillus thermozeamaize TaxID=230954 RepID=A0A1Y3PH73_9BACI|nr:MAG: hypothetical protein BAA01_10570 [Bacillus thermozeamaize]
MLNQGCQQNRQPLASVTGSYVQFYASIIWRLIMKVYVFLFLWTLLGAAWALYGLLKPKDA